MVTKYTDYRTGNVANERTYFASDDADKTVAYLNQKSIAWFDTLMTNDYLDKMKRSWLSYHGVYYEDSHAVSFGGEQGELVNIAINHYRNLAQHMLVMVTSNRPAFQARSTNTDYKSQTQTILANGLLDYYMREKRLEKYLKSAVEHAIVMGSGFIKMEWNSTAGEIYDYIKPEKKKEKLDTENAEDKEGEEDKGYPIYEGDVEFKNLSGFDVVFDSTKESANDHDWVLCRTWKNKYDLAAKYPEFEDEIKMLMTKSDQERHRVSISPLDETFDVPVYEFFHKKTESMPDGRYLLYLSDDIILMDSPMPYRSLPVFRISPGDILGTPYGYTSLFDLLPIQDALNSLYSTVMTNQNAFGVQNILNPRGNDIKVTQLEGNLNFVEYNAQMGKPEPLQLTATAPETFNFMQILERAMETISGVNSVARGNPESSLKSGNALALVQSQALQFISGLQQSYIQLIEDVGTGLVNLLRDFAKVPRVAAIAGLSNRTKMQEFTGDDLDTINRVIVDAGNALAQTPAGRSEIAQNLNQMGLIKSPEQYLSVLNTGKLETMTEGQSNELLLIKAENERLVSGKDEVRALAIDSHSLHIREHKNVLADPDLRDDPTLISRTLNHIQQHIELSRTTDPDLLALIGEQPLGPEGGSPISGETASPDQPSQGDVEQVTANPASVSTQSPTAPLPSMPKEARPDGDEMAPVKASEVPLTS